MTRSLYFLINAHSKIIVVANLLITPLSVAYLRARMAWLRFLDPLWRAV